MPITQLQKEERREHLGSSDMAAVLGVSPFATAYDVWLEKTGQLQEQPENDVLYTGRMLEDGVLNFAEDKLGRLQRNVTCGDDKEILRANVDALIVESGQPVEAKTSSLFRYSSSDWGPDESDEVPDHIIIQTQVHMICTDQDICHVPALIGLRGLVMFHVSRQEKLVKTIQTEAERFWNENVMPGIPPADVIPNLEVVKWVIREPKKTIDVNPMLLQAWINAKELAKEADEMKEQTQAALLAALADAEQGNAGALGAITYFEQSRKVYDFDKDITPYHLSTYRVLRHKKPKKGAN